VVAATIGKESTALRANAPEMVDSRIGESAEDFAREGDARRQRKEPHPARNITERQIAREKLISA
jgi:hypothetical protein